MATEVELVKLSALTTITTDLAALTEADRIQTGLDVLATNVAKEAAEAAASVSGDVNFYDTYADASAAVSGLTAGDIVEVIADETLSNLRTRYRVETGSLAFKLLLSPIVVGTTANLRAIPYSGALNHAQTLGSFTDDDNAGGAWRWDAASTATDNIGTVIKPTGHSGAGRWLRDYSGAVNIKWFTTNEADYTSAIGSAITVANGNTLHFPAGEYTITHDIVISDKKIRITGDGCERSIINRNGQAVFLLYRDGDEQNSTNDVEISDLQLVNVGVKLWNYTYSAIIDKVSFIRTDASDYNYNGIYTAEAEVGAPATLINNLEVTNCTFIGMSGGIRTDVAGTGYNSVFVFNNYCLNNAWVGIVVGFPDTTLTTKKVVISHNKVVNTGDYSGNAPAGAWIVGIRAAGDDVLICNNIVENVVASDFWESDGIYVKQRKAVVTDNILVNAGYRSGITTKQLDPHGTVIADSVLIHNNQIYFDAENLGFSGNPGNVFDSITNFYGGINIVSYNTIVSNNFISGAGFAAIYNVNSTAPWLMDHITVKDNTIVKNRGRYAMYLIGAGKDWVVTGNTVRDFDPQFSTLVSGICLDHPQRTRWVSDSGLYWVAAESVYQNKQIINPYIANNYVDIDINTAYSAYGLELKAEDAVLGGTQAQYPATFEQAFVVNNHVSAKNAGAGAGFSYIFNTEPARFINCYFNTQQFNTKTGFSMVTGYGLSGYRTHTANPNGVITPYWTGDMVLDTTNGVWYKSKALTSGSWVALN